MNKNTEELFKAIIKNSCLGLKEIVDTDPNLTQESKIEIEQFLLDMDVNYFMLKRDGKAADLTKGQPMTNLFAIEHFIKHLKQTYKLCIS